MTEEKARVIDDVAVACGLGAALVGALVLMGWAADVESLKKLLPGAVVMIPNTALALTLAGNALWVEASGVTNRRLVAGARIAAAAVLLLAAITLAERLTGADLGSDRLLFAEEVARYRPGRMASNTAVSFTLAALGLLTVHVRRASGVLPSRWFATAGLSIAGVALAGYLYNAKALYRFDQATEMALVTAIGLLLLHLGILMVHPHEGKVSLVTGSDLAGRITRRLLPATIILPLAFGWLWKTGREAELFSRETGVAMFAIVMVASLIALVIASAHAIRDTDHERERILNREREARAEADAASRVKGEFLATMSHELRTPLNAIIGYSNLLAEGLSGDLDATQQRQVNRIAASADHLLALIEQVLTLSQLEAGKSDLVPEPVNAGAIVAETADMLQPLVQQRGLVFHADVAPGLPALMADAPRLRQVLVNLLGNAVKFTDHGDVGITVWRENAVVRFEVWDTGIGIDPANAERVFEPFWQAESRRTRRSGGTGLGLAVSRQLVHAMGGEIAVHARQGGGSVFTVTLPCDPSPPPPTVRRPSGQQPVVQHA